MRRLADPNCPRCHGAGHLFEDSDSIVPVRGRTCACVLAASRRADVASRVEAARLPVRYAEAAFEHFGVTAAAAVKVYDPDRDREMVTPQSRIDAANLAAVRGLAARPLSDEVVAFIGPFGVGKTYLACALLLAQIRDHGRTGLYLVVADYIAMLLPNGAEPEEQREIGRLARSVDVLLLDDLGTEKGSAFSLRQLWSLLHDRTTNGRAILITSNLKLGVALLVRPGDRPASGAGADATEAADLGARIYSRLTETRVPAITWPEGSVDRRYGQQGAANRPLIREARREVRRDIVEGSSFDSEDPA